MAQQRLSFLDRNLTLWIFIAMGLGIAIGVFLPQASVTLDKMSVDSVNIPRACKLFCVSSIFYK
ncbi:arsenite transporter [Acinetobacter nosocomialis]|nr:arsenite transporter [Acinetobacter nosocomialis]